VKWRLVAALIATTLLVILVQDIPLSFYLQGVQRDRIVTGLERDAFVLAGRSEEGLETPSPESAALITEVVKRYQASGGARVIVVDAQGIAVATSDADDSRLGASYLSRPEIATALGGEIASGTRYSTTLQQELLYVTVPVFSGDAVLGAVRLTYPAQVVDDAVARQLRQLWVVAVTTVLLAGIVGYIVAVGVTQRLKVLKTATERLADGHLDERADEGVGASEIRSLSRSFNVMAERLDGLMAQQRAFAADASHQLRTPLTALRLKLERARDLIESDPQGAERRLVAAEAEADRLGTIIEGLLLLSRSEASDATVTTVDVAAAARARVAHWLPLSEESRVHIRFEGAAEVLARAVDTATEQIVDNFIDNALSVSPPDGTILVRVAQTGDVVAVHVLDDGPGLSAEDCARAFDRFWRGSSDPGGSGLGLAIVAQLAAASGGSAKLEPRPGGGLDASVLFPAARPE
jgi:signal transduction histidine kinase